jgi:hypothetical protein
MIKTESPVSKEETQQKYFEVDINKIHPLPKEYAGGGNIREEMGDIPALGENLKENGILKEFHGFRDPKRPGHWFSIDGHRRSAGGEYVLEKYGILLRGRIRPIDIRKMKPQDFIYHMMNTNTGKENTPMEFAEAVRRLIEMGEEKLVIAKTFAKSPGTIDNYYKLSQAPRRIKDHIREHRVNYGVVLELLNAHTEWEKVLDVIDSNLKVAQENAIQKAKSKAGDASNEINEQEVAKGAKVTRGLLKTTSTKLDSFKEVMRLVTKFDSGEHTVHDDQYETMTLLKDIVYNKITFQQLTDKFFAE